MHRSALNFVSKLQVRQQLRDLGARRKGDSTSVAAVDESKGPCPECAYAERCTSMRLACVAFQLFVDKGGDERWRGAPRVATAEIYRAIYVD